MRKIYNDFESLIEDGIVNKEMLEGIGININENQIRGDNNCVELFQPEFKQFIPGESVAYNFSVLNQYLNPRKTMNGGYIASAFDLTFGGLFFLECNNIANFVTIDMAINYHKPVYENDRLTITAKFKNSGKRLTHMIGEAVNQKGELIASASTNLIVVRD